MTDEITREQVLQELWAIARAKTTDILTVQNGTLAVRDTGELTESQTAAIAAIEKSPGGVKVKFYDKLKALELLGKYMGLFDSGTREVAQANNLLDAILAATGEEVSVRDLPEVQQAADARHDLVEPAGAEGS